MGRGRLEGGRGTWGDFKVLISCFWLLSLCSSPSDPLAVSGFNAAIEFFISGLLTHLIRTLRTAQIAAFLESVI